MSNVVISFPMFGEDFAINPSRYIELFGLKIHWYGVIILTGLILAVLYIMSRRKDFGMSEDNVIDMLMWAIPIGVVGARLYYVVFNFSLYKDNLLDIFKVWEGGLAIYGGIIFGILGLFIYHRRSKIPMGTLLDISSLAVIIGQAVGRWGNFINREAFGGETTLPWRMGLTYADGSTIFVHPTFLYESLWNVIGFIILHIWSKKHRKYDGQVFLIYAAWYGIGRFFIEGLRTDSLYLFGTGIRVSQLIGILAFIAGVAFLLYNSLKKAHNPDELYVNKLKLQPTEGNESGVMADNESDNDSVNENNE